MKTSGFQHKMAAALAGCYCNPRWCVTFFSLSGSLFDGEGKGTLNQSNAWIALNPERGENSKSANLCQGEQRLSKLSSFLWWSWMQPWMLTKPGYVAATAKLFYWKYVQSLMRNLDRKNILPHLTFKPGSGLRSNLAHQKARVTNPWDICQVFIWESSFKQCLERGRHL